MMPGTRRLCRHTLCPSAFTLGDMSLDKSLDASSDLRPSVKTLHVLRYLNAGNSRVVVVITTAEVKRYQNTILGTSSDRCSTPMLASDSCGMTSY